MGYVEREDLGLSVVTRPQCDSTQIKYVHRHITYFIRKYDINFMASFPSFLLFNHPSYLYRRVINVCLLGGAGVGKADLVRSMSNLAAQALPNTAPVVNCNNSGLNGGSSGGSISGSGFYYAESDVADIESEGYPLHVLKVGYDCDVEDEERGGGEEPGSGRESSYVHGSCSHVSNKRVSIVFTAVPYDRAADWIKNHAETCDVAVLVLDCAESLSEKEEDENADEEKGMDDETIKSNTRIQSTSTNSLKSTSTSRTTSTERNAKTIKAARKWNRGVGCPDGLNGEEEISSLLAAQKLATLLPGTLPRLFVANGSDVLHSRSVLSSSISLSKGDNGILLSDSEAVQKALKPAYEYLQKNQLLPLLFASTITGEGIAELKNAILKVSSDPASGIPLGLKRRVMDNKFKWMAGKVFCAVITVALIASAIVLGRDSSGSGSGSKDDNKDDSSISVSTRGITGTPYRYFTWIRKAMMRVLGTTSQRD